MDGFLDQALAEVQGMAEAGAGPESLRERTALAARMVEELGTLPEDTPVAVLVEHLAAMAQQVDQAALRVALMDPIYDGTATALQWRAAVVHATEPDVVRALAGETYPRSVFAELDEVGHLELFSQRCRALLLAQPGAARECPEVTEVLALGKTFPGAIVALKDLAGALTVAG